MRHVLVSNCAIWPTLNPNDCNLVNQSKTKTTHIRFSLSPPKVRLMFGFILVPLTILSMLFINNVFCFVLLFLWYPWFMLFLFYGPAVAHFGFNFSLFCPTVTVGGLVVRYEDGRHQLLTRPMANIYCAIYFKHFPERWDNIQKISSTGWVCSTASVFKSW